MMKLDLEHEKKKKLYSVAKEATKFCRELEVDQPGHRETDSTTNKAKEVKNIVKKQGKEQIRIIWEQKPLHGQYLKRLKRPDVNETETHKWLKSSGLKSETEGLIIAAQDQSLMTKQYQSEIMKNGMNPKCRLCNQYNETIDHIVSGCPVLAKSEFMQRHDKAASYIYWKISKAFNLSVADKWYNRGPDTVVCNDQVTLIWDMEVHTDKEIKANKPDIIIKDHINSTCQLIDMIIPSDRNVSVKEIEKFSKYKDLEIEIGKMWKMKVTTIPVVIGALGALKKGMKSKIDKIPGKIYLEELQKITLLGTAHILRKILSSDLM